MHVSLIAFLLQLRKAVGTDGQVRRDHGRLIVSFIAVQDSEITEFTRRLLFCLNMDDFRRHRLLCFQRFVESLDPIRCICQDNVNQTADVAHFALHPEAVCQFSNKGPKADPLHDSPYFYFHGLFVGHFNLLQIYSWLW